MRPFVGIVEIGRTYLDTWGNEQEIFGSVRSDNSKVWSVSDHFDRKTGRSMRRQLVQLPRDKEIAFWKSRLARIYSVNHVDNLALVQEGLNRIKQRLITLMKIVI